MADQDKTKEELISELAEVRRQMAAMATETADRRWAEESLLQREAELREAQEVARLGLYVLDIAQGRWTSSRVLDQIFGIGPGFSRTVEGWGELLHPDERHLMLEYLSQEVIGHRGAFDREYRVVRYDDKQVRWVHGLGRLEFDKDNQPISMLGTIQDITERKRSDEEATASKAMLSAAIECLPFEFFAVGKDGRYVLQNATLREHYGDAIGKRPEDYAPDEATRELWIDNNRRAFAGQRVEGEIEAHVGGVTRHLYNILSPIHVNGEISGILGVNVDISERRRAEESLRENEQQLRLALDASAAGTWSWNALTNESTWDDRYHELYGFGPDQPRDHSTWLSALHPDDRPRVVERIQQILSATGDNSWSMEFRALHSTFGERWHYGLGCAIRDAAGQVQRMTGIDLDVTDRKRAEVALQKAHDELERRVAERTADLAKVTEELRLSEERYRLAVRSAGVGIWDFDVCTGKLFYSPRWKQLFGFEEHEIGDSLDDWIRLLHPDERDRILKFQEDFLASTESTVTVEYRLRHKDGSYRWVVAHGLAVRDSQGKAVRLVGSHGDITDRKRAEEALAREHRTLKQLLQSSDHERQLIAYEIHDGLAQQLAGAIMQFQTFAHLKTTKAKDAAKAFDAGMTMLQQGHYETRRLIAGVRPPILDEQGVAAAVGHLVNEQIRLKNGSIEYRSNVRFDRLVPTLENAIYRITQEALANACQHSKSEKIRVSLLQRANRVRIEVRDWGVGFDPRTTPENRYGLEGIRQRARILDGKCSIRSRSGQGTRVLVELPVVERQEE